MPNNSRRTLEVRVVSLPPHPISTEPFSASLSRKGFHCKVVSRFNDLRVVQHPHLCEYVDIVPVHASSGGGGLKTFALVSEGYSKDFAQEMVEIRVQLEKSAKQG